MLSAEGAILVQFQLLGGVSLVLVGIVVALLALRAPKRDLHTVTGFRHIAAPPSNLWPNPNKKRRNRSIYRIQRTEKGAIHP